MSSYLDCVDNEVLYWYESNVTPYYEVAFCFNRAGARPEAALLLVEKGVEYLERFHDTASLFEHAECIFDAIHLSAAELVRDPLSRHPELPGTASHLELGYLTFLSERERLQLVATMRATASKLQARQGMRFDTLLTETLQ